MTKNWMMGRPGSCSKQKIHDSVHSEFMHLHLFTLHVCTVIFYRSKVMFQLPLCHCDIEALLRADKMLYVVREYTFMAAGYIELEDVSIRLDFLLFDRLAYLW